MHLITLTLNRYSLCLFLVATMLLITSCGDDPEPEEEEELITTLIVTLAPQGGGDEVTLMFYDEDGETGSIPPEYTVSGPLSTNTVYEASITLLNETDNPAENITEEIEEEKDDHIFCFTLTGLSLTIDNLDKDNQGLDVGLSCEWTTEGAGTGTVRIVLRHQPGTKTGTCPGSGSTDIDVTFNLEIVE